MPTGLFYTYCRRVARRTDNRHKEGWTMPKGGFKGKKAAPFAKGGGRKQSHPHTAKGQPRKK